MILGHSVNCGKSSDSPTTSTTCSALSLEVSAPNFWKEISPAGTVPNARVLHVAVYDEGNDRMIGFGGGTSTAASFSDVLLLTEPTITGGTPKCPHPLTQAQKHHPVGEGAFA